MNDDQEAVWGEQSLANTTPDGRQFTERLLHKDQAIFDSLDGVLNTLNTIPDKKRVDGDGIFIRNKFHIPGDKFKLGTAVEILMRAGGRNIQNEAHVIDEARFQFDTGVMNTQGQSQRQFEVDVRRVNKEIELVMKMLVGIRSSDHSFWPAVAVRIAPDGQKRMVHEDIHGSFRNQPDLQSSTLDVLLDIGKNVLPELTDGYVGYLKSQKRGLIMARKSNQNMPPQIEQALLKIEDMVPATLLDNEM